MTAPTIYRRVSELQDTISRIRREEPDAHVGFVPTMGALHEGHLYLIREACAQNDYVVVSVFVNPRQFNQAADFESYPREPSEDARMAAQAGAGLVFIPEESDMYPCKDPYPRPKFDLGQAGAVLEAAHRPGHFEGVLDVVHRLFCMVRPDRAYFGLKDYQQYLIVRDFSATHHPDLEIVGLPTQRASDGLALSSRNQRLSAAARRQAPCIYQTLRWMADQAAANACSLRPVEEQARQYLEKQPHVQRIEYLSFRDALTLDARTTMPASQPMVVCAAVWLDGVRLIDNLLIPAKDA